MEEKKSSKRTGGKVGTGILFVAACFVAMYILMEYHDSLILVGVVAIILLISAYLFLNALFEGKERQWISEDEMTQDIPSGVDGELWLKISKHMKEVEGFQKDMLTEMKKQNAMLEAHLSNVENNIVELSDKQVIQTKTLIKYNKENARQLAINERETLEHVMQVLKKAIEDNAGKVMVPAAVVEPGMEELSDSELIEMPDFPADEDFDMRELPPVDVSEEVPQIPVGDISAVEEAAMAEMLADFETPLPEEPVAEPAEEIAEEPEAAPATDPLAGLSSDPNAMMTPDDIAKMLEAMQN